MKYYDAKRDELVDGLYLSADLLAFLRDTLDPDAIHHELNLSTEGLAGLWSLLRMVQQCLHEIARQVHPDPASCTTAALNQYLTAHPEAEVSLHQLLERARSLGFTAWDELVGGDGNP